MVFVEGIWGKPQSWLPSFCEINCTKRVFVLILIARKGERSEPYFIGGPHDGVSCIKALGVGSYWKYDLGAHIVVGEAMNGQHELKGDTREILLARRKGDVWGRWYSKYCPDGEMGFVHFRKLLLLSKEEYLEYRDRINGHYERDKWANI